MHYYKQKLKQLLDFYLLIADISVSLALPISSLFLYKPAFYPVCLGRMHSQFLLRHPYYSMCF